MATPSHLVKIRWPVQLQRKALKRRMNSKQEQGPSVPVLISCRYFPHRLGQTYDRFKPVPLSSGSWTSRRSIGRHFTFNPWPARVLTGDESDSGKPVNSFENLGLDQKILNNVAADIIPTRIQNLTIPKLLVGESALITSEPGSGKTLAYLLPIIHRILSNNVGKQRRLNSPSAVIVTPSRELSLQIHGVAERLVENLGIKVRCVLGGSTKAKILHGERSELDILIGSLGAVNKMFVNSYFFADSVEHVVFDEVDTLLDDTFSSRSLNLLRLLNGNEKVPPPQLTFVGSTYPSGIEKILDPILDVDSLTKIETPALHKVPRNVSQKFIRTSKIGKFDVLLEAIEMDVLKKRPILIFANKASTADWLTYSLNEHNIDSVNFTSNIHWDSRHVHLAKFTSGNTNVLVSTDLASRGLDFPFLKHVINYDFPLNMSDYIHRVGRVGRVGSVPGPGVLGKVTNFVCTRLQLEILQKIEKAHRLNKKIPSVSSNIIRIIERSAREKAKREGTSQEEDEEEELL